MDDGCEHKIVDFECALTDMTSLSLKSTTLTDGRSVYVLCGTCHSRETDDVKTHLVVYDPATKTVIGRHKFATKAELCSVSSGKALLAVDGVIVLFCLKTCKVVAEFSHSKSDSDTPTADQNQPSIYRYAKFDSNPDRSQFVVFTQDLSSFQLMDFDDESATLLHRGGAFNGELREPDCRRAILSNGLLFAISFNETLSYEEDMDEHVSWPNPHVANILVFDLKSGKSKSGHPLVSLTTSFNPGSTLLNGFLNKFRFYSDKLVLSNVSDDRLLISTGYANLLKLDSSRTSREVAEHEANELEEEQLAIRQELEAKIAAKESKKAALAARYKSSYISGFVKFWKGSFGFVTPEGNAAELGDVYLHLSQVENSLQVFLQRGVRVFFYVEYDPRHKNFSAVRAKAVPDSPFQFNLRGKRGRGGSRRGYY